MFEAIVVGALALVTGTLAILVSAYAVLAASPLARERTLSRVAPAMAGAGESDRVTSGAPVRSGFVIGLVRSLMAARNATRRSQRDTTS